MATVYDLSTGRQLTFCFDPKYRLNDRGNDHHGAGKTVCPEQRHARSRANDGPKDRWRMDGEK